MGGRASLILVIGFSLIFMAAGLNFNNMATSTTDNMLNYYTNSKAHHIAASGVNLIVNQLFLDAAVPDQTYNFNFDGGTISATLTTINAYQNIKQLISTGTFDGTSNSIKVVLKPSLFSKYAYFSASEGGNIWWNTGDTVWGPFHTNDNLRVAYQPVFMGKVSIGGSEIKYTSNTHAQYLGGFQKNIHITIPSTGVSNVASAAAAGGAQISGHSTVYFEFRGDSVRYKYSTNGTYTYQLASKFAPNGVIYVNNATLHLQGTVKGQYTIAVSGSSGGQGDVYLDDNIVYNTNPVTNPNSTDMLGIVAQSDVIIADNAANNNNIAIQASIYCQSGSFKAENYDTRPAAGFIDLYGGITQNIRGPVGTFGYYGISTGFNKRYRYDTRLLISYPPSYPGCGTFEIVSWFE